MAGLSAMDAVDAATGAGGAPERVAIAGPGGDGCLSEHPQATGHTIGDGECVPRWPILVDAGPGLEGEREGGGGKGG